MGDSFFWALQMAQLLVQQCLLHPRVPRAVTKHCRQHRPHRDIQTLHAARAVLPM